MIPPEAEFLADVAHTFFSVVGLGVVGVAISILIQAELRTILLAWLHTLYLTFVICVCTTLICLTIIGVTTPFQPPAQAETEAPE